MVLECDVLVLAEPQGYFDIAAFVLVFLQDLE